jgi:hypothetical protein
MLSLFAGSASAATVYAYNNFGKSGDLYNPYGNWIGDRTPDEDDTVTHLIGVSFEASETGTLAGITAAIWGPGSGYTSASRFSLSLYEDDSGVEGAQVWSQDYSFNDIYCCFDSGNGVTDFSISNGEDVTLNASQTYWLVAETSVDVVGSFSWYADNTGARGGFHMGRYNEETGVFLSDHLPDSSSRAFSLSVSTVPLPAAFWLFGSALLGMGLFRRGKEPVQLR